jgi:flagellar biosynthesis GTPase FlhF
VAAIGVLGHALVAGEHIVEGVARIGDRPARQRCQHGRLQRRPPLVRHAGEAPFGLGQQVGRVGVGGVAALEDEEVAVDEAAEEELEEDAVEEDAVEEDAVEDADEEVLEQDEAVEEDAVEEEEEEEDAVEEDAVEEEEAVTEDDEAEEEEEEEAVTEDDEAEEEDEEVFEVEIMGKNYYTNNISSGDIYEIDSAGDPGDQVGHYVHGIATFTR